MNNIITCNIVYVFILLFEYVFTTVVFLINSYIIKVKNTFGLSISVDNNPEFITNVPSLFVLLFIPLFVIICGLTLYSVLYLL